MDSIVIVLGLAFVIMAGSIAISFHYYREYKRVIRDYLSLRKLMDNSYIKVDARVHNAIYEAYDQAVKKDNQYEARIFSNLLQEVKGKW